MKRFLLLSIAASISLFALADLNGAGYYRVHNLKTGRYASVVDNRGRIDYANTTADLQAVRLQKNFDEVCADPATVLYVTPVGNSGTAFQMEAQGTGIYQIIGHYLHLKENGTSGGKKLYKAYGEMDGIIKYLGDGTYILSRDFGNMVTHVKNDYTRWFITPIDEKSDNFFGVKPTIEYNGKYYTTMYAQFPFSVYSPGVKVYRITGVSLGGLLPVEAKGTVPAATPVLIECSSPNPSDNRLIIGGTPTKQEGYNYLKGVYFCSSIGGHINRTPYDKATMRVLGICSDGRLGFIPDDELDFMPANKCYLPAKLEWPDEFKLMDPIEFEAGVEDIIADDSADKPGDVFNLLGERVLLNALPDDIYQLPAGIYICNGRKYMVR